MECRLAALPYETSVSDMIRTPTSGIWNNSTQECWTDALTKCMPWQSRCTLVHPSTDINLVFSTLESKERLEHTFFSPQVFMAPLLAQLRRLVSSSSWCTKRLRSLALSHTLGMEQPVSIPWVVGISSLTSPCTLELTGLDARPRYHPSNTPNDRSSAGRRHAQR